MQSGISSPRRWDKKAWAAWTVTAAIAAVTGLLFWVSHTDHQRDHAAVSLRIGAVRPITMATAALKPSATVALRIPASHPELQIGGDATVISENTNTVCWTGVDMVGTNQSGMASPGNVARVAVGDLLQCLQSQDSTVVTQALWSLAEIGCVTSVTAIVEFRLTTADQDLQRVADEALASIRNWAGATVLADILASGDDPQLVFAAQRALAGMIDGESVSSVAAQYWELDDQLQRRVADLLSLHNSPDLVPQYATLLQSLKTDNPEPLCVAAVHALVHAGTREALDALIAAADTASEPVGAFIIDGIGRLSDPELFPHLVQEATGGGTTNEAVRVAATLALGNFDKPEASSVLESIQMQNTAPSVAAAAEQSLARLNGHREFTYDP